MLSSPGRADAHGAGPYCAASPSRPLPKSLPGPSRVGVKIPGLLGDPGLFQRFSLPAGEALGASRAPRRTALEAVPVVAQCRSRRRLIPFLPFHRKWPTPNRRPHFDVGYAHHVFSPCLHHAAARFSGVSTPLASARIIHVKPHQSATQPPWM
jgi:hypothetical protein